VVLSVPIDVAWEVMDWPAEPSEPAATRVLRVLPDDHSVVACMLSGLEGREFPYLRFISHETVTVFHQQHIGQLITEPETLSRGTHDAQAAKHLSAVLQLVTAAHGVKDTLVAFRVRKGE
jgi:ribosomal protein L22